MQEHMFLPSEVSLYTKRALWTELGVSKVLMARKERPWSTFAPLGMYRAETTSKVFSWGGPSEHRLICSSKKRRVTTRVCRVDGPAEKNFKTYGDKDKHGMVERGAHDWSERRSLLSS